jgi:hypothetical protein
MKTDKPVVVLIFAILNIVFGSIGSLCSVFTGIMTGFAQGIMSAAGMPAPPFPPDVIALSIVLFIIQFILSVVLIFAGVGLLGMKPWARNLCIVLSILGILYSLVSPAITIGYNRPRMRVWQEEFQEQLTRQQQNRGIQQPPMFYQPSQSSALNVIQAMMVPVLVLIYAVAMLMIMSSKDVSAAFAGRPIRRPVDSDRELDDEWRERRD